MNKLFRIFLPLLDNEGNPFADAEFVAVSEELTDRFGGVTYMKPVPDGALIGRWVDHTTGRVFQDEVIVYYVAAELAPETDTFMTQYKEILLPRFRQLDIFIAANLVEIF